MAELDDAFDGVEGSAPATVNPTKKRNRPAHNISIACSFCREKRSKCSGEHPCSNCAKRGLECVYPESSRRKRQKTAETPNTLATAVNQAMVLAMPTASLDAVVDSNKFLAGQIEHWREMYRQQKFMCDILWHRSFTGDVSHTIENENVTKFQLSFLKFVLPMSTNFNFSRVFGPLRNTTVNLNSGLPLSPTEVEELCDILDWHIVMSTGALLCGQLQESRPFILKAQETAKMVLLELQPTIRAPYTDRLTIALLFMCYYFSMTGEYSLVDQYIYHSLSLMTAKPPHVYVHPRTETFMYTFLSIHADDPRHWLEKGFGVKTFDNWSSLCIAFGFTMRVITRPFSPVDTKLMEYVLEVIDKVDVNSALRDYGGDEAVVMSHWYGVHAFLLFQLGKIEVALEWAMAGLNHVKRYIPPTVIQPMVLYCCVFIHHIFHKLNLTALDQECEALEQPYFDYIFCSHKITALWKGIKMPPNMTLLTAKGVVDCPLPSSVLQPSFIPGSSVPSYCTTAAIDFAAGNEMMEGNPMVEELSDQSSPLGSSASDPSSPSTSHSPAAPSDDSIHSGLDSYLVSHATQHPLGTSMDETTGIELTLPDGLF